MPRTAVRLALPAAALAAGFLLLPAAAQPLPAGSPLRYVPADAAVFVHADAAALWAGPVGEAARKAAPKEAGELTAKAKELFGVAPDQLKTVTVFWPKVAGPADTMSAGVVLTFKAPYDRAAFQNGLAKNLPPEAPVRFVPKDATTAVLLIGRLDDSYGNPRPASDTGPLTPYLREAATGAHLVAAGLTQANLPPDIRGNDLPPDVEPFRPLFHADAAAAFLDVGKELALEVRVKSKTAAKAADAEKALGVLLGLAREGLSQIPAKELADPAMKSTTALVAALKGGLKDAKVTTTATETRARVALPGDLPFAQVAAEATVKLREAAARAESFNNLRQIGLAMHNYHDTLGSLPPAAVVDRAGRPLLSWRVLILPYIEQQQLYNQFKLDEAWDGPTNKKLLDKMPRIYALPPQFATKAKATETHYQAFVGKGAAFDVFKGPRLVDFFDGTSNTVLVGTAATPVPWTKPDDIAFDPAADMTTKLGFFPDVAHVAFGDGSVRALRKTISRQTLAALITRSGGEVIGNDDF
ncbi:MAG: DUF1559 domain-containing protein [Gemmataceae bacterium]